MATRPSAVWDYFKKLPDAMLCTVCPDGGQRAKLAGNNAGNAKKHLKFYHAIDYEDVESRDMARTTQSQPKRKSTAPEQGRQTQEKNLAAFLATPSIPVNIVSNKQFRRLIYGFY